jgi:hypothetical protein
MRRPAEALPGLKPQEVRALWLHAALSSPPSGQSHEQICEVTGWT